MKKTIIFITLLCILLSSCANKPQDPSESNSESETETETDGNITDVLSAVGCTVFDFGIPYIDRYPNDTPENIYARTVWDMQVFDGKLFIAAGDYVNDKGPLELIAYNFATNEYESFGELDDEQICKFKVINDTLFVPGTDPKGYPYYGHIYTLEEGAKTITENDTVPEGVNCFDICASENLIFAATGTDIGGTSPVCISRDWGRSFKQVNFIKNGEILSKASLSNNGEEFSGRCHAYNIFTYRGKVFCTFGINDREDYAGLYIYSPESECFEYYNTLSTVFGSAVNCRVCEYNGELIVCNTSEIFTMNGQLSKYTSLCELGENEKACDMLEKDGKLYILTSEAANNGMYTARIRRFDAESRACDVICSFEYGTPFLSVEYYGGAFYLGAAGADGDKSTVSSDCGRILKVVTEQK